MQLGTSVVRVRGLIGLPVLARGLATAVKRMSSCRENSSGSEQTPVYGERTVAESPRCPVTLRPTSSVQPGDQPPLTEAAEWPDR